MGIQGFKHAAKDSLETWFKPLKDGDWAVCFLNSSSKAQNLNFNWKEEIVNDTLSKRDLNTNKTTYSILNLWTKKDMGKAISILHTSVPSHDVLMLRLKKS